jgi:hypothetical protein
MERGKTMKNDFGQYMNARTEKEAAYNLYNYAGAKLELASINERLAEIKSQHEPIADLLTKNLSERDKLCAIAFYVVVGRFPEKDL